ncbi:exodeoxyribonuclease V subunit gamma [Chitinibacter sp. SCUT-21]|uniref:exodeoxyribonuclease V subunit gamma n=1 Tax=Chitinibacter sp. SCUT-21 TaxID=2970891 RepID=UPI0035A5F013
MSSRLNLFQSNRLENLFELMQALFAVPLSDPFASEKIIVSSKGMERWLRFQLAERVGICSGVDFALPAGFIWRLLQDAMPGLPAESPYSSGPLAWRLFGLLPQSQAREASPIVAAYLAEGDERRRMALAGKLADVFDQYLVFRSDWIAAWEEGRLLGNLGPDEAWQAKLWCEVRDSIRAGQYGATSPHRAEMFVQLFTQWAEHQPQRLPERLTVFGISSMPPAYIDVLGVLAEHIDVNLFLLNPCMAEWGAIVSPKALAFHALRSKQEARAQEKMYLDVGHPLLASMGKAGRDFFRAITERFPWSVGGDGPLFSDPCANLADANLLRQIQSDILHLYERGHDSRFRIANDDQSLTFHRCHSAMREVEVLHDRLCAMLARDKTLLASEIAVLLPDLGPYAPLIEAVFGGAAAAGAPVLPYNIADLSTAQECPAIDVYLQLFNLPDSRCTADEIFGLIETPQVARRFGIAAEDLATLQHWIDAAAIRWGLNAAHRAEFAELLGGEAGLAALGEANTWQAGLDSLLLGAALPQKLAGDTVPLWHGIAPWDQLEGSQVALLAKLKTLIDSLSAWRERLKAAQTLADWAVLAQQLLEEFLNFDPEVEAERLLVLSIRESLAAMATQGELAEFGAPVERKVVLDDLRHRFDTSSRGSGFMSRGITFCTMVPMRGLPFRVIAVLGLNETDFPRNPPTLGFDLIAQNPQLGDRSRRLDDRFLFLEIILAARDALYLSWVGRGVTDNETYPPSVLVSDLIDCVRQGFGLVDDDDGSALLANLINEYPLQVFSPKGFEANTPSQSYNPLWADAANRVLGVTVNDDEQFTATEAIAPEAAALELQPVPSVLSLDDLASAVMKPAHYYLRMRAELVLDEADGALAEDEPFDLRDFADRAVRDAALQYGSAAQDLLLAQGKAPLGTPGQLLVGEQIAAALQLKDVLPIYCGDAALPVFSGYLELSRSELAESDLSETLHGETASIQITLADLYPNGQHIVRSTIYPRDAIRYWIRHLALCCCAGQTGVQFAHTRVLSPDQVLYFPPLATDVARAQLIEYVRFYRAHWRSPQPFFTKSALMWGDDEVSSWEAVEKVWYGSFKKAGECEDPSIQLLWPNDALAVDSPQRAIFAAWAECLLHPLHQNMTTRSLGRDLALYQAQIQLMQECTE